MSLDPRERERESERERDSEREREIERELSSCPDDLVGTQALPPISGVPLDRSPEELVDLPLEPLELYDALAVLKASAPLPGGEGSGDGDGDGDGSAANSPVERLIESPLELLEPLPGGEGSGGGSGGQAVEPFETLEPLASVNSPLEPLPGGEASEGGSGGEANSAPEPGPNGSNDTNGFKREVDGSRGELTDAEATLEPLPGVSPVEPFPGSEISGDGSGGGSGGEALEPLASANSPLEPLPGGEGEAPPAPP